MVVIDVCVCVCRSRSSVYCVIGCQLSPAVGGYYWKFDVLHQKKTTCKEVQKEVIFVQMTLKT